MKNLTKKAPLIFMILLLVAICFVGCSKKPAAPAGPMGEKGTWGIFVYLCGSNLETKTGAAGKNIDELLSSEIPDNVNVILQTGGAARWRSHYIPSDGVCRFKISDGNLSQLEKLPQSNMGAEKTFEEFLTYCVKNYPAEKMCAIVWDHGGGSLGGVANDENYDFDALSLAEMDEAIQNVSKQMTDKFELFGFDACLMANYETADMLSPYARYMLASEEIEPSGGWDYGALIDSIAGDKNISGGDLCKEVADAYFNKCRNSDKDATATLSALDLSKFGALRQAFGAVAQSMKEDAVSAKGIQQIAQSAKLSQKYGGTTDIEGYSNLIDLGHFAENFTACEEAQGLVAAINDAVICNVFGKEKSQSRGLSFFYPLHYDAKQLQQYFDGVCPSETYEEYLDFVYTNIPTDPIKFSDKGSKREDGSFGIKLDPSSIDYVLSYDFDLVEFALLDKGENLEYIDLAYSRFGRDNDLLGSWADLDCHSNFRGIWITLNGCKLFVTPIETTAEYVIYTAPIILNGKRTNLRFAYIWDEAFEMGGYYKILGAWNGIDPVTGMSDKELTLLKSTDSIQVEYPYLMVHYYDEGDGFEVGDVVPSQRTVDVPVGTNGYEVYEDPLENNVYVYQFVVTDIFGVEHYSNAAIMQMNKTYDELKANPLPDGVYAADVFGIMEMDGESIMVA